MALRLITKPAVEPVTLERAKEHLRVDHSYDDLLISAYIEGARTFAEQYMQRALVTQTWEFVLDEFPANEIEIPMPPLQSVTSIKYDDGVGVEQTLGVNDFDVDTVSQPGWVVPSTAGWPSTFDGINAVRIQYVAGYAPSTDSPPDLTANIPGSIKSAVLLHVGQLYAQRESDVIATIVNKVPSGGIMHLMRQYRVALGMA